MIQYQPKPEEKPIGIYESYLDIKEIGTGVYFILYQIDKKKISKKLVVIE